ncbi:ABC transporter ATP-binding protein [Candidatus Latescibacterota bacterium]
MIKATNLTFAYPGCPTALKEINLTISPGSHVAVMGKNGSGKTTLALLLKGILRPSLGNVVVDGFDAGKEDSRFEIMKRVGIVFQNPDDTIVATTVERELAFGLENTGVPPQEIQERVDEMLNRFDLETYRHTNPSHLSGGEKQRLALAAVMIMEPFHLILDEPTSLLDPWGREQILRWIRDSAQAGATIIHITQFAEDALLADRLLVLDGSGISGDGSPEKILAGNQRFRTWVTGFSSSKFNDKNRVSSKGAESHTRCTPVKSESTVTLSLDTVTHRYDRGTPYEKTALSGVALELRSGSSTALMGAAGSGKTTLLEIAAGVTEPTEGRVRVDTRIQRAMAFQFPEDQMFGDTVETYVAFGPENTGVPQSELQDVVTCALEDVGLDAETCRDRDPLTLSGGEKRRAALAGVLAMNPDVLILDEPTAGLDWEGMEIVKAFLENYVKAGGTLLFSTHDFEMASSLADRALVLDKGRVEAYGTVSEVFSRSSWITSVKDSIASLVKSS